MEQMWFHMNKFQCGVIKFKKGQTSRLVEECIGETINAHSVKRLFHTDRCMKLREIANTMNMPKPAVHRIVNDTRLIGKCQLDERIRNRLNPIKSKKWEFS